MIKKNQIVLACVSFLLLSGCGGKQTECTIRLNTYEDPLDFHTDLQMEYLSGNNPAAIPSVLDGRHEYGKPNPITISWRDSLEQSYVFEYSETEDFSEYKSVETTVKSVDIKNLKIDTTYFYRVKAGDAYTDISSFVTSSYGPRNLDIDGITNVRDCGGWSLNNGSKIKQGLLYRGARLNNSYPDGYERDSDSGYEYEAEISEEGKKEFKDNLGIKTEVDFRTIDRNGYPGTDDEVTFPNVEGVNYVAIPTDGKANIKISKDQIREFFALLSDQDNYPLYFHCNIGTDRTGMMAYLLGAFLGMNENDLYMDYMFSDFATIAMPTPINSNPTIKALTSLTSGDGSDAVVRTYEGSSLKEKATNCLLDCGISASQLSAIEGILIK